MIQLINDSIAAGRCAFPGGHHRRSKRTLVFSPRPRLPSFREHRMVVLDRPSCRRAAAANTGSCSSSFACGNSTSRTSPGQMSPRRHFASMRKRTTACPASRARRRAASTSSTRTGRPRTRVVSRSCAPAQDGEEIALELRPDEVSRRARPGRHFAQGRGRERVLPLRVHHAPERHGALERRAARPKPFRARPGSTTNGARARCRRRPPGGTGFHSVSTTARS